MFAPPPLRRTLEAAFRDLDARDPSVRQSAVRDLGHHDLPEGEARTRAIDELCRRLRDDDHAAVRAEAAVALADLRAHEAATQLLVAVEDAHGHVRQMALCALGEVGATRALPRIERALTDERPEVRYQATIAFFRLCDEDAPRLKVLRQCMQDADDAIRYIALRLAEEHLLGSVSDDVLAIAAERLQDEAPEVVLAAAIMLGHAGDRRCAAVLTRVVQSGEAIPGGKVPQEDECEALELVGRLQMQELRGALERRAFGLRRLLHDTCSLSARVGLARMGDARAIAALVKAVASGGADTRTLATVAAGRSARPELRDALVQHRATLDADLVDEALARLDREIGASGAL